ncbi:Endoplasmic reticulum mannosyl-oligosaccharide 1,2-alpha-mannosidase, variant 2, partial [Clonorchis sinensis]
MLSQTRQPFKRTLAKSVFVQHMNELLRRSFEKRRKRWLGLWMIVLLITIFGSLFLVRAKSRRIFYLEQTSSTVKRVKTIPRSRDIAITEQIREAARHSWRAYKKCAWGNDIVHPLACEGSEWMSALLTMVDSLDTLWIMKLNVEFDEARKWISSHLAFNSTDPHINVFETTIRLLGGLLSAYTLSKDRMFLGKATMLGDILLGAFDGMSAFPMTDINLSTGKGNVNFLGELCLAEVATIQLEFNELSRLTRNPIYAVWVQTGKVLDFLRTDYIKAIEGIKSSLVRYSKPNRLLFVGELDADGYFLPRMDHLVCFLPGTLAYGILHNMTRAHLELAESLMHTCYEMYNQTATRLSPENILFDESDKSTKDFWPA